MPVSTTTKSNRGDDYERIHSKVLTLVLSLKHKITSELWRTIVDIASKHSPSSAFRQGYSIGSLYSLTMSETLGVAKLTRWLAVIRRDYSKDMFRKTIRELEQILNIRSNSIQPETPHRTACPQNIDIQRTPQILSSALGRIIDGIYKYGKYDWIAEARLDKISALINKELRGALAQLAIEIFYSLYLINTELAEPRIAYNKFLKMLAKITEPLRNDQELRFYTVFDERLSITITAEIMKNILSKLDLSEKEKKRNTYIILDSNIMETVRELVKKEKEKINKEDVKMLKESLKLVDTFTKNAGVLHKIEFKDMIDLAKLLSKYTVFLTNFNELLRPTKKIEGGTYELSGYEYDKDLKRVSPIEFAYPNEIVFYKILAGSLRVRKYKEGVSGKERGRKYVVLIDKSGSMRGHKIEWAKAVAVSMLLKRGIDDVAVMFFDSYYTEPVWLKEKPLDAIKSVLSVKAGGSTNIVTALKGAVDKTPDDCDIVLITDGISNVKVEEVKKILGNRRLLTFYIEGDNEELKKASTKFYTITPDIKGAKTILKCL